MIGHRGGVNVRSQEGSGRLPAPKSGAKPKGRNLTPPEVTGEGAFVSGKALLAVGSCYTVIRIRIVSKVSIKMT